jgi:hypothetical protein
MQNEKNDFIKLTKNEVNEELTEKIKRLLLFACSFSSSLLNQSQTKSKKKREKRTEWPLSYSKKNGAQF